MATDTEKRIANKCRGTMRSQLDQSPDARPEEVLEEIQKQFFGERHGDRLRFCSRQFGHALENRVREWFR